MYITPAPAAKASSSLSRSGYPFRFFFSRLDRGDKRASIPLLSSMAVVEMEDDGPVVDVATAARDVPSFFLDSFVLDRLFRGEAGLERTKHTEREKSWKAREIDQLFTREVVREREREKDVRGRG